MATVTNTVKLPDGSTPDRVDVVIELVASTTGRAAGWITATDVTLEATVRPAVTAGAWTASLIPNADITPSGSVYKVTEYVDKTRYIHYIEVGSGGGSLFDLLVDPPASLATAASELYADAAAAAAVAVHTADTSDAHDASAISVLDTADYFTGADVETVLAEVGVVTSQAMLRTGNKAIIIGDSLAAGSDDQANYAWGGSWFSRMCMASAGRIRAYRNAGVPGNTSTQMLARFASDVVAHAPDIVIIAGVSPNDVTNGLSVATSKANIQAMVEAAHAANIRVFLATSAAHDTTATKNTMVSINQWLVGYANSLGIPVIDLYTPTADVTDGTYQSAYTSDGVHPTIAGQRAIATAAAAALPIDLRAVPFLTVAKSDPVNLVTNGVFNGDANADGYADSWTKVGGGITAGALSAISGGYGNWQQVTCNGSLGYMQSNNLSGWSVGDVLAFGGRYEADATTTVSATITFTGGAYGSAKPISSWTEIVTDQLFYFEVPVPTGTTVVYLTLSVNTTAGNVRFGQITVRNLTTLGIA